MPGTGALIKRDLVMDAARGRKGTGETRGQSRAKEVQSKSRVANVILTPKEAL